MKLYHRTSAERAATTLAGGFIDAERLHGFGVPRRGVWLWDVPPDITAGAGGDTLLEVTLEVPNAELDLFEWVEGGRSCRKFLMPAALLNGEGKVRIVPTGEPAMR